MFALERTCAACNGHGQVIETECPACAGAGRLRRERTLSVNIPPGVDDGTSIRLAGEGEAGAPGVAAGDLYVCVSILPHEFFQREGADLHCRVPISMVTAALGGEFEVLTIEGSKARVKVREGTQSGLRFRLKGKGIPVAFPPERRHVRRSVSGNAAESTPPSAGDTERVRAVIGSREAA